MPSATEPTSRSPSPAPAPPLAEAPGTRAQGLINVYNSAIGSTLKKCSTNNFASCFPTAAQYNPEVLEHMRQQMVNQLDMTWKANFEALLKERDVVRSLNALDRYVEDAKNRKAKAEKNANGGPVEVPVPPHTLPPSMIHLAHLMPFLEEQATEMNSRLESTQQANTELLSTITAQRAEIEALVRGLENVVHDLEASAQMMGQDEIQGLSREIKDLEMEMKK
ncbi:Nnf1-domain-containing protein [Amniculicola lignicola CBS 123094]|uniref:Nnf1-domain-containing protein n=1 Tax=Amniculicola lignicola CBS 123094 TaxID=1392246 RepID=A0A6A5X169_9PLEO|nr:Nnf1-domain-containing protein [Amniculicola lignicola CBS 123094]